MDSYSAIGHMSLRENLIRVPMTFSMVEGMGVFPLPSTSPLNHHHHNYHLSPRSSYPPEPCKWYEYRNTSACIKWLWWTCINSIRICIFWICVVLRKDLFEMIVDIWMRLWFVLYTYSSWIYSCTIKRPGVIYWVLCINVHTSTWNFV